MLKETTHPPGRGSNPGLPIRRPTLSASMVLAIKAYNSLSHKRTRLSSIIVGSQLPSLHKMNIGNAGKQQKGYYVCVCVEGDQGLHLSKSAGPNHEHSRTVINYVHIMCHIREGT